MTSRKKKNTFVLKLLTGSIVRLRPVILFKQGHAKRSHAAQNDPKCGSSCDDVFLEDNGGIQVEKVTSELCLRCTYDCWCFFFHNANTPVRQRAADLQNHKPEYFFYLDK